MTQTSNEISESQPLSLPARLLWIALILSTLYLCYFHNLGALGLVGPDEPRYAWIARDMQETGDWVTPRLYGNPWFEKPPLYYWGAALSFKLFGVSETSARLPSAISALLATLALAWLALRLYGPETARWFLLLLPTTVGMIGFSHAAATDMPFAAMLTIAMVFATRLLNLVPLSAQQSDPATNPQRSFRSFTSSTSFTSFLFGFFLGLATLAKGPAAIILSGGAVLVWAFFTKRWRDAFRCLHPVAIASFCLTALPWYILCARRNPDFFRVFIIEHNFNRFLTPQFQHIQPFWFYVPVLCICFLPWLYPLGCTVYNGLHKLPAPSIRKPANCFLLSWSAFCFLFFSISRSKLPGYVLPAVPAIGLLFSDQFSQTPSRPRVRTLLAASVTVLLFIAAEVISLRSDPSTIYHLAAGGMAAAILFLTAGVTFLLALAYASWDNAVKRELFRFLSIALVLGTLTVWPSYLSNSERGLISSKALAEGLPKYKFPLKQVFIWKNANRSWLFGTRFYLHAEVLDWDPSVHKQAFVITGGVPCSRITELGYTSMELPIHDPAGLWFVCRFDPESSAGGLGGGNAGDGLSGRQPR